MKMAELLATVRALNAEKKYDETIALVPDDMLTQWANADLYAEKALAYWRTGKFEKSERAADTALKLNSMQALAWHYKGNSLSEKGENEGALSAYSEAVRLDPKFPLPYNGIGNVYNSLKRYDEAFAAYFEATRLDPKYSAAYNGLGNVHNDLKRHEEAITAYQEAIRFNRELAAPHNGLGNVYYNLKRYEEAINAYDQAIRLDHKLAVPHNGKGSAYFNLKRYDDAIAAYQEAIRLAPDHSHAYYNLGLTFLDKEEFEKAVGSFKMAAGREPPLPDATYQLGIALHQIDHYEAAIEAFENFIRQAGAPTFLAANAKTQIDQIRKKLDSPNYEQLSKMVTAIKNLLFFNGICVTHYTRRTVTSLLVLKDSALQLSEGVFLNDTSEGRELFNFLNYYQPNQLLNETEASTFAPKPFIGSFVPEAKHDDLALWRMYGKEDSDEARGCSITFYRKEFLDAVQEKVVPGNKTASEGQTIPDFNFFFVAYRLADGSFAVPGKNKVADELNSQMQKLKGLVSIMKTEAKVGSEHELDLLKRLNEIAYLFKSVEYQYEHEIRLVVESQLDFEKKIDIVGTSPRVHIDLVPLPPLLKKITLGPKMERAEEWAAAFYYHLEKTGLHPEIIISRLPFK